MQSRRFTIGLAAVIVGGIGWYLFRPERLLINQTVNEGFTASAAIGPDSATPIASGRFHGVAHNGQGNATVHQFPDGRRVLRFTAFETSNGPDLRVYLVAASDASDSDTVKQAGFVDLGALKGNQGDQNYDIPAGLDLSKYRAATVWCRRFGVNFATAPLKQQIAGQMDAMPSFQGQFHGVAHSGKGTASVYQLADGRRVLRFTEFETSNGPELRVYLVAAGDATDSDMVKKAGFIDLGALKGNRGDQNYELPSETDLSKYRAATVWCRRFSVNFATAPLAPHAH